ncbi:MFS transporter [Streptomyces antimycoticus]|uniref:MFS transporter n=1 Tax=Streptomyces antimycoticus TaxID=68175 RepID=UPI0036897E20
MVSGSLLLCGIDLTVLHVAVPSMSRELKPSPAGLLWIVDVYSLSLAALLVTCGTLGDRIGRRRMVLSGFVTFGLASAAAAFSASTAQLIAARAVLGVGAAMIMASTVAIIRVVFTDDRERAVAIGIWTAAHSVGATIGPLAGGLVTAKWGWGAVFLINVPMIVVILAIGARVIPESRNPVPRRWDLASVALSVTGLAGVVYALKQAGEHAGVNGVIVATAVAGSVLLYVFVRRQRRIADPLLDFSLFRERRFTTATLCVIGCFGSYVALLFFLTQWLQQVGEYAPLCAGLALMPLAGANAIGAVTAPWAANRWDIRWALTGALALVAAALATTAAVGDTTHYGVLLVPLLGAGYGAGIVMTLGADSIMSAAQPERSGEAAANQGVSLDPCNVTRQPYPDLAARVATREGQGSRPGPGRGPRRWPHRVEGGIVRVVDHGGRGRGDERRPGPGQRGDVAVGDEFGVGDQQEVLGSRYRQQAVHGGGDLGDLRGSAVDDTGQQRDTAATRRRPRRG